MALREKVKAAEPGADLTTPSWMAAIGIACSAAKGALASGGAARSSELDYRLYNLLSQLDQIKRQAPPEISAAYSTEPGDEREGARTEREGGGEK